VKIKSCFIVETTTKISQDLNPTFNHKYKEQGTIQQNQLLLCFQDCVDACRLF